MLPHWEWTRARTGLKVRPQLNLEAGMKSQDETLEEWCRLLLRAFELEDLQVDVNEVLSLAGVAAHSVHRGFCRRPRIRFRPGVGRDLNEIRTGRGAYRLEGVLG